MTLKSYLVDDGAVDGPVLSWAVNANAAKAVARKDHGPDQKYDAYGHRLPKARYEAVVTHIVLEGVIPPATAGLEIRPDVLEIASRHPLVANQDADVG